MKKILKEDLERMVQPGESSARQYIKVGMSSCGIAAGAEEVFRTLVEESAKRNITIEIKKSGCLGMCHLEPLVEVSVQDVPRVIYGKVTKDSAVAILEKHVVGKSLVQDAIVEFQAKEGL